MSNLNLTPKEGWLNRHTDGLPIEKCSIRILAREGEYDTAWEPFDPADYEHLSKEYWPAKGYLGACKVINHKYAGIGFHAWRQSDSEFIYYKSIDDGRI